MSLKQHIYRVLFDTIQEGLIVTDKKGVIVLCNPVCDRLFGYSKDELVGQKIEILVPSGQHSDHVRQRKEYNKSPKKRSMASARRLNGARKDGSTFPVEVSLNPFEEDGEKYVAALVSNVTIKRKIEDELIKLTQSLEEKVNERTKELWQSEQLYKSIARNFPGGVINIFDKDFNYLFAEGQGLYEIGLETEDLIGLNYLERLDEKARKYVRGELALVFKGQSKSFEIEVRGATYLLNAVPLRDEIDEIDRILVVEKNITSLKEVELRLAENLKKEKELNEMKSRFVSMASHEFRTPLTTINSSAGLINKYYEKGLYEKSPKHVGRIRQSVAHLTTILNDFLSLEKLESGRAAVKLYSLDLVAVIKDVSEEMEGLRKSGQTILFDMPDHFDYKTDAQLMKNILINLISNAFKYSGQNGKIKIYLLTTSNAVKIIVQDNGIGIPKEDQPKMFDRFFRAENVLNIEGTGLGLTIVVKYLELLNGSITFESEEGIGTKFIITLPKN
jgi:PAS domain S-box-containing protein